MCPESGIRLALFTEVCDLLIHALSQIFRPFRAGRRVDLFLGLNPRLSPFAPARNASRSDAGGPSGQKNLNG
jgi:hypothetical protein